MRYSLVNWVLKLGSILVAPLVVFMSTGMGLTKRVRLSGLRGNSLWGLRYEV